MTYHNIEFNREAVAEFCRSHGIRRLSLFGSILRADFRGDSDIDILIEFDAGQTPSLMDLGGMQVELSEICGREVDLKTLGFMSQRIRQRVLSEALLAMKQHTSRAAPVGISTAIVCCCEH